MIQWRPIEGFPGYRVGSDGSVWSQKNGRWGFRDSWRRLSTHTTKSGHKRLVLSRRDPPAVEGFFVHHLVLVAFRGPAPEGQECCHRNGRAGDNRLENLRWGTRKSNVADSKRHGTFHFTRRALTDEQVLLARELHRLAGRTEKQLARQFGVSTGTIRTALQGTRSYRHLSVGVIPSGGDPRQFVTQWCGLPHSVHDGRPNRHWCNVLSPTVLRAERQGRFDASDGTRDAARVIAAHRPSASQDKVRGTFISGRKSKTVVERLRARGIVVPYDVKCHALAETFLAGRVSDGVKARHCDQLAREIQRTIDAYLSSEGSKLERGGRGPAKAAAAT